MSEPTLRDWLNDEQTMTDALAVLKVGIEKGDSPFRAFQLAVGSVLTKWIPEKVEPYHGHDERVARLNRIFREFVLALIPKDEAVIMITCPFKPGLLTYISNVDRPGAEKLLEELLGNWRQSK